MRVMTRGGGQSKMKYQKPVEQIQDLKASLKKDEGWNACVLILPIF
jgi:hypothetical protein